MRAILARVADGARLGEAEAEAAFEILMSGDATPSQTGAFLMALRVRGETIDEITGAARIMREKALRIEAPADAIDTAGTGGDDKGTLNISTAAALLLAGAGVPVVKHGNRALSSQTGASDVLGALGVDIDCDMALVSRALDEAGICFLMAPRHHGAMRHVAGTRVELGTRTIFNLLGPPLKPRRRAPPACRRVRGAMDRAARPCARQSRRRARLGRSRLGRHGRAHHHGRQAMWRS